MSRAPTPLIVRLPLTRDSKLDNEIARLYIGVTGIVWAIPPEWLGGDVSLRAFADAAAEPPLPPTWIDVYLSTDDASTCVSEQYPTNEAQTLRTETLGKRLMVGDQDRRFWMPSLSELVSLAHPVLPAALYLVAMGNQAGAWLEIGPA